MKLKMNTVMASGLVFFVITAVVAFGMLGVAVWIVLKLLAHFGVI